MAKKYLNYVCEKCSHFYELKSNGPMSKSHGRCDRHGHRSMVRRLDRCDYCEPL